MLPAGGAGALDGALDGAGGNRGIGSAAAAAAAAATAGVAVAGELDCGDGADWAVVLPPPPSETPDF